MSIFHAGLKGILKIMANSSSKQATLDASAITNDRTYTLPDTAGTLVLTSDIPVVTGDITAVGDVTSGAAFDGTQGKTLTLLKENEGTIKVGNSTTSNTIGGKLVIRAGDGNGAANGGDIQISSGSGGSTKDAGSIILLGGTGGSSGTGGDGYGGGITLIGGTSTVDDAGGGDISITAGTTTATNGYGASVSIFASNGTGTGDGGYVTIKPGNSTGGAKGKIDLYSADGTGVAELDADNVSSIKNFSFPNQGGTFCAFTSGSGAPGSTPTSIGQFYVDTTGLKFYGSTGTASSSDWKILN